MKTRLLFAGALVAAVLVGLAAWAIAELREPEPRSGERSMTATRGVSMREAPDGAFLDHGRAVAVGATGLGPTQACRACHGLDGVGNASGAFPRLDLLTEWYIYKQLHDYAGGSRPNEIMTPIAQALSEADIRAVAGFYAKAAPTQVARPVLQIDPLTLQQGGAIAAIGASERGVAACQLCHGAHGEGAAPAVPPLAAQYAPYAALQLDLFRRGVRRNDAAAVMRDAASRLTDAEIEALAVYFASLTPPREDAGARTQ